MTCVMMYASKNVKRRPPEVDAFLHLFRQGRGRMRCGLLYSKENRMKDFAAAFYKSRRWQACRAAYLRSVGGLCERCLRKGLYRPAVIVHHKVYITPETIDNPDITLSWSNLEAVCRECHEDEHRGQDRRYIVKDDGSVIIR